MRGRSVTVCGIGLDGRNGRPIVEKERFRQRRQKAHGAPFLFVNLKKGRGFAWAGESTDNTEGKDKVAVRLEDPQKLAITSLGNLTEHPHLCVFESFWRGGISRTSCLIWPGKCRCRGHSGS